MPYLKLISFLTVAEYEGGEGGALLLKNIVGMHNTKVIINSININY